MPYASVLRILTALGSGWTRAINGIVIWTLLCFAVCATGEFHGRFSNVFSFQNRGKDCVVCACFSAVM